MGEGRATRMQAVRDWFRRDLYEVRPISMALAILAFIPGVVAEQAAPGSALAEALREGGAVLAAGWLLFILAAKVRRVVTGESWGMSGPGETPCPVCGEGLPPFEDGEAGEGESLLDFRGWTCGRCGSSVDRFGREIRF